MRSSSPNSSLTLRRVAARVAALVLSLVVFASLAQAQSTPAGTAIHNRVLVRYMEPAGETVTTQSPVVTVVVAAVPGVAVTPDETAPNGVVEAQKLVTAHFSICNTGNQGATYLIVAATVSAPSQIESIYLDLDGSGAVSAGDVAVTLSSTVTPLIAPGGCLPALVVYQVGDAPSDSQLVVTLTARFSEELAGNIQDSGTVRRVVKERPRITDPDNPALPPSKTVNGVEEVIASPSQTVQYEVAFRNSGETTAERVRVLDRLPQGTSYVAGSLRLTNLGQTVTLSDAPDGDDGEVTNGAIEVRVPEVKFNQVVRVSFSARIEAQPSGTVLINRAQTLADNAPEVSSREARVIVSPQGKVFDGESNSNSALKASLRIVSDSPQGPLTVLPADSGFVPNASNYNPYSTGSDGMYSFRIPSPAQAETYYLLCDASDYKSRVIRVNVMPGDYGRFGVTLTALDGQPLAVADGFSLTNNSVSFTALGAFAWNVPMFSTGGIETAKTVDRAAAEIGDVLTYRVEVRNTRRQAATGVVLRDTLPQSFYYVPGTARLESGADTQSIEPEIAGDVLTFRLPDIPAGASATLVYRVRIGVNARIGENYNVAVGCLREQCSAPGRASVTVRAGVFSNNQILIGRVFIDANRNARFDKDDRPVAGARLVTSNGQIVITDTAGNYSFPVLGDGALAIELDRTSIPSGFAPSDARRADGARWSRVLATPLQRSALLQASFPLVGDSDVAVAPFLPAPEAAQAADGVARLDAPQVELTKKKKRSFWSKLVFWRREKNSRPHSLTTTVIVPANGDAPCPPSANVAESDSAPAAIRVEVTAPSVMYSTSPAPAPVENHAAPVEANAPASSAPGNGGSVQTAPVNYIEAPRAATAPIATLAARETPPLVQPAPAVVAPAAVVGVNKVAPGSIELDVEPDKVAVAASFNVPVRVALGYEARLYLNGVVVDSSRIGERRIDHTTQTEQITFVGLSLSPGPNKLRVIAVAADGREFEAREVTVMGRGPAVRLAVEPERAEVPAGRREKTGVVIRAYDEWGNPALDGDLAVQTSAGSFDGLREAASLEMAGAQSTVTSAGQPSLVARPSRLQNQITLKLVGGVARVNLVAADAPTDARLLASTGSASAQADVRFVTERDGPRMIVGLGNITIGRAAPVMDLRQVDERVRGSLAFFFKGRLWSDNVLTLSYDSQRPLQRLDARDRLFQIDPLERSYFVMGDSSTRFGSAPSNSKLYARLDFGRAWGRSFVMFGDFTPDSRGVEFSTYNRKLTGVQAHFENANGDYISLGGARPSTAFGRDVFPGDALGFVRLSTSLILPGSETVTLEARDRRNPDIIVRSEPLQRGADYNLDADSGQLFFIRALTAFDASFNLQQVVVTYEYEAHNGGTNVYTARAVKKVPQGGSVGFTAAVQGQGALGNYVIGGFDMSQEMPNGGLLRFEYARTNGKLVGAGNFFTSDTEGRNDGEALLASYDQPLKWRRARLQMSFRRASKDFLNPFGSTIVGGSQRAGVSLDLQASRSARLRLGLTDERNNTEQVSNSRQTAGLTWTQVFSDKLSATLAYDFRRLSDARDEEKSVTTSHMLTVGFDYRPTDRITLSARREQNIIGSDPTYPNQTVFSGTYRINNATKFFITQRLSSAPIVPISDLSGAGFGFTQSRRELNTGVETKFLRDTSLVGGYRLEQGQDGNDGFAIIGLSQRWKLGEGFALDASYERAFHLTGEGAQSGYNNLTFGATWQPSKDFVANSRYQFRDRDGSGHLFAAGFMGKPLESVTALGRFQLARGSSFDRRTGSGLTDTQSSSGVYGSFGVAVRPVRSDRTAFFLNYQHRSLTQGAGLLSTRERSNTMSADAFLQAFSKVALFGKFAVKSGDASAPGVSSAPTLTYLMQGRTEYQIARRWDFAIEARLLKQPSTNTSRAGLATELGFWVTPDIRFGGGYNFTRALEGNDRSVMDGENRRGFYFSITTKLERVFDFFGAHKKGSDADPAPRKQ